MNEDQLEPAENPEPLDFFLSYTGHDVRWAEWIAAQLEQTGYRCVLQACINAGVIPSRLRCDLGPK